VALLASGTVITVPIWACPIDEGEGEDETGAVVDGDSSSTTLAAESGDGSSSGGDAPEDTDVVDETEGAECQADDDCGPHRICFDAPRGSCGCTPGRVLCGTECVDLATDDDHCGRCNDACGGGVTCTGGRCGASFEQGSVVEPPVVISGGTPAATCMIANETKPERSMNAMPGGVEYFAATQVADPEDRGRHSFASADFTWTTQQGQAPSSVEVEIVGDPWATTHGGTGQEYLSYLASIDTSEGHRYCTAVASASAKDLRAGPWVQEASCIEPDQAFVTDGPAMLADPGSWSIYLAYVAVPTTVGPRNVQLTRFAPCGPGAVGDRRDCPLDWKRTPSNLWGLPDGHANVVVNPCTGHAIVLGRTASYVRYAVFDGTGHELAASDVDRDASFERNTACGGGISCETGFPGPERGHICHCGMAQADCGQTPGCWDLERRVHAAVRVQPSQQCTLLLSYDRSAKADDGETYMKSRLRVLDVTDDAFVEVATFDSSPSSAPWNDFNATVTSDRFSGAAGMFFYRQDDGDPCTTTLRGIVSRDGGRTFEDTPVLSGPFPTMRFTFTDGMGHYVEASQFTEPGWLVPSWSQPLPISSGEPCVSCQGIEHSLVTMAARVRP